MEITIAYIQMTTEKKIEQTGPNLLNIDVGEPIELNDNEGAVRMKNQRFSDRETVKEMSDMVILQSKTCRRTTTNLHLIC